MLSLRPLDIDLTGAWQNIYESPFIKNIRDIRDSFQNRFPGNTRSYYSLNIGCYYKYHNIIWMYRAVQRVFTPKLKEPFHKNMLL